MLNKKAFSSLFHCSTQKRRFYIFSERRRTTPEPVLPISGMKMIEAAGSLFPRRSIYSAPIGRRRPENVRKGRLHHGERQFRPNTTGGRQKGMLHRNGNTPCSTRPTVCSTLVPDRWNTQHAECKSVSKFVPLFHPKTTPLYIFRKETNNAGTGSPHFRNEDDRSRRKPVPGAFRLFRTHWPETSGKRQEEPPRPRNRKSTDEGQRPEESFPSPDVGNVVARFIWTRPKHMTNIRTVSYPFRSCFYDRKQCAMVHVIDHTQ